MSPAANRALFVLSGLYDFLIGMSFLLAGDRIFEASGVPFPNHWGYVEFAALLLIIFGLMFFTIARDPVGNRNLMPFGMLLKVSYSGLVAYYWLTSGVPMLFKPFAIIDGVMLVLFAIAYLSQPAPR